MVLMQPSTLALKVGSRKVLLRSKALARQGRKTKWAFGSSRKTSIFRGRCKLLCSLNFLLQLRVTVLPTKPSHKVSSWVCDRMRSDAGTEFSAARALPGQAWQCHKAKEGPGHSTFVGGWVCCGSGGCSVVPIGSSNRGLDTQQPEGMRTKEEMKEELGQAVFSNSGPGNITAIPYPSTEHKPPGRRVGVGSQLCP